MKGFWNIVIGVIVGLFIGSVCFLAWSERVEETSFAGGLITGLTLYLFVIALFSKGQGALHRPAALRLLPALLVLLIGFTSAFLMWQQREADQRQRRFEWKQLQRQDAIRTATQSNSLIPVMNELLGEVRAELEAGDVRTLGDETLMRLSNLGHSMKPYLYLKGDSVSEMPWSPERGQLLLALIPLNMDSVTWKNVLSKVSFEGADLSGRDLKRVYLSGIDLFGANLTDTDLRGADLSNADLGRASARGVDLQSAVLSGANLEAANLSWAELNGADLQHTNFQGSNLQSAKLRQADLYGATMRLADLGGAMLSDANLTGVQLIDADLSQANLSRANLTGAVLKKARMHEAVLSDANLSQALVRESDWLGKLSEWQVVDAEGMQQTYETFADAAGSSSSVNHRIRKKPQ